MMSGASIGEGIAVMREGSENGSTREKGGAFRYRWIVWGVMVLAYMVVFFHRLAAGVVRDDLVQAFSLSATSFGNIASMYLYAYMIMQIPVGMLADSLGARATVTAGMVVCGAGSLLFGLAPSVPLLMVGRFLVGVGVSTVFVSILKIQSQWFREREFGAMSGLTALIGNLGGVIAQTPLAILVAWISWRTTFAGIGALSVVLAALCFVFIRNSPAEMGFSPINEASSSVPGADISLPRALGNVLLRPQMLPATVVAGAFSGTYLAFSGAWGAPFLSAVYGMDKATASGFVAFMIYGTMAGSFLSGWISDKTGSRKKPLVLLAFLASVCWGILTFAGSSIPTSLLAPLLFFMGLTGTCYVISWAYAKELNAPRFTGIGLAVLNTGSFLGSAALTTFMGVILDASASLSPAIQYERAFLLCFVCCVAGVVCALALPETKCRNISAELDAARRK